MLNQSSHVAYGRWGGGLLTVFTIFILLSTFKLEWISMPLSEGWLGTNLVISHYEIPLYLVAGLCYLIGTLAVITYPKTGGAILIFPSILAFCWPILISIEPSGILPAYFEEARARSIIEQVLNLEQHRNVNIQPAYQSYFDISSIWEQISFMYAGLSFGWYLFCTLGFIFPLLAVATFAKENSMSVIHLCGLLVIFSVLVVRVADDTLVLPKDSSSPYTFSETLNRCEDRINKNSELAHSDYFISRCAEAYNYIHSRADAVAGITYINKSMGGKRMLRLNEVNFDAAENHLFYLRQLNANNLLTSAFQQYGARHYKNLQHIKAKSAIEAEQYNQAKYFISNIPESDRDYASWFLYGYAASKLGQVALAENSFNQLLLTLKHDAIAASLFCSFGDSMALSGEVKLAREYYKSCYEQDNSGNYWAVHKLGGT